MLANAIFKTFDIFWDTLQWVAGGTTADGRQPPAVEDSYEHTK